MAPTPSTASSRSLSASQRKRTSKSNRALPTTPTRHLQTHSLPTPQTSSASKRSSSRNASKDVIDLSNNDFDADSDVRFLSTTPSRQTRSRSQGIASSSRNVSIMELSEDSDADIVAAEQAPKAYAPPVDIGKRLADVLKELDASKKKIEKASDAGTTPTLLTPSGSNTASATSIPLRIPPLPTLTLAPASSAPPAPAPIPADDEDFSYHPSAVVALLAPSSSLSKKGKSSVVAVNNVPLPNSWAGEGKKKVEGLLQSNSACLSTLEEQVGAIEANRSLSMDTADEPALAQLSLLRSQVLGHAEDMAAVRVTRCIGGQSTGVGGQHHSQAARRDAEDAHPDEGGYRCEGTEARSPGASFQYTIPPTPTAPTPQLPQPPALPSVVPIPTTSLATPCGSAAPPPPQSILPTALPAPTPAAAPVLPAVHLRPINFQGSRDWDGMARVFCGMFNMGASKKETSKKFVKGRQNKDDRNDFYLTWGFLKRAVVHHVSSGLNVTDRYITSSVSSLFSLSSLTVQFMEDIKNYDLALFQETHLRPEEHERILLPNGYNMFGKPAPEDRPWGGVVAFVRKGISAKLSPLSGTDLMVLEVEDMTIANAYVLPESSTSWREFTVAAAVVHEELDPRCRRVE
ncbi:hypothetical protein BT96DRAFT_1008337 [Gymnopus androsaceus JB14]|uniref:Uncharacterized protein n=1 Tax=Gymnopus androsaceus JB14 TaxID=1447944 RepID=A0A6A4GFN7_9AGAR|nr:hypothetical protein BT96DRAFT_1008337 [Gymnopus androsaceus JB14]